MVAQARRPLLVISSSDRPRTLLGPFSGMAKLSIRPDMVVLGRIGPIWKSLAKTLPTEVAIKELILVYV